MAGRLRFTVPGRLPFLAPVRAPRADETEVDVGSIVSREGGRFEGRVLISGEIPPSFPWPILLLSGEDDQLAYGGVVGLVGTTVRTDNEVPAGHWTVRLLAAGIVSDVVEVDVEDGRSTPIALAAWHEAQVVVRLGESIDAASQVELAYRGPHETAYRERRRCGRKSSPDGVGGVLCDSPDPDRTWNAVTRTHRFLRLPPGDYVVRLSGGATAAVERAVHLLEGATVVVDLDAPR
jgi:hypothetical protein